MSFSKISNFSNILLKLLRIKSLDTWRRFIKGGCCKMTDVSDTGLCGCSRRSSSSLQVLLMEEDLQLKLSLWLLELLDGFQWTADEEAVVVFKMLQTLNSVHVTHSFLWAHRSTSSALEHKPSIFYLFIVMSESRTAPPPIPPPKIIWF